LQLKSTEQLSVRCHDDDGQAHCDRPHTHDQAFSETSSLSPQILQSKKALAEFSAPLRELKIPIQASRSK
jgi:hypothetical protein